MLMHKHCKLNVTSLRVHKMLQDIETTKCRKIVVLRSYQRGGNLKKGEVNFERGGSDPPGNYAPSLDAVNCVSFELVLS